MPTSNPQKPKRQKKKKPRTEVSSRSESDSPQISTTTTVKKSPKEAEQPTSSTSSAALPAWDQPAAASGSLESSTDQQVRAAFTQRYMQRATVEFAEDLDKIREADDFKGVESVEVLVRALRQGVEDWEVEGMRRVVGSVE